MTRDRIALVAQAGPAWDAPYSFSVGCRACAQRPGARVRIATVPYATGQGTAAMGYAVSLASQHVSQHHEQLLHLEAARKELS